MHGKEQFVRVTLVVSCGLLLLPSLSARAAEAVSAKFVGAQGCAASLCHGGAGEKRGQYAVWSKLDFHTRAPATLSMARSSRMAETLRIADATADARCTSCHNPLQAVPAERKLAQVGKLEGVSCESCHNAGESWLLTHTRTDLRYEERVAAGLRDLKNLYVRANTCVGCHQNLEPALRAAGHPELTFEMDGQCASMPRHWAETNRLRGAQAWWVGQAVALREGVAQAADPKAGDEVRACQAALAWLLGIPADGAVADQLARSTAAATWDTAMVRTRLGALAATYIQFETAGTTPEAAHRAERVVLGLERLMVALQWQKHPALSPRLDDLFRAVQSRPDFAPKTFAAQLKALGDELKKVP